MMRPVSLLIGLMCWTAGLLAANNVYEQVLYYPSVDQHGDSLILSGKVSIPKNQPIKGVVLLSHFTIGANKEAPSTCTLYEAKPLRNDYILIMPDYIGYGVTTNRFPPYLHGPLTARNCVDMIPAAQRLLDSLQLGLSIDSLYLVGYSQGAAVAIWTLRHIEEHCADRYHVKQCIIGGGPYDVAATYDVGVQTNKVGMPMAAPLLVEGTSEAYNLHLNRRQLFTPTMDKRFDRLIASRRYDLIELTLRMPQHRLDHWLSPEARDKNQPETRRLYEGLMRSSLVHYPIDDNPIGADTICPNWTPQAPIYVFHSYKDDVVPFVNAEHLQRCYHDLPNITWHFGDFGSHLQSAIMFIRLLGEKL